jgi:hypothetical protein
MANNYDEALSSIEDDDNDIKIEISINVSRIYKTNHS